MRSPFARRSGAMALLLVVAAGFFVLGGFLSGKGMAWASEFCGIAGFFLTVVALIGPSLTRLWRDPLPMSTFTVSQAADDLASALLRQWTEEEKARRVNDPRPLPVRWEVTAMAEAAMLGVRLESGDGDGTVPALAMFAGNFDDVLSVFLRVPSRRLVFLGSAGAGKSVLATKLAQGLLATRKTGAAVPVIFPAATWDPVRDMSDWMADQLIRSHPQLALRPKAITGAVTSLASALASTSVLPIVDGLDELPEDSRIKLIAQINAMGSNIPLIVTSRPEEYLGAIAAAERPISQGIVVELLPLRIGEVKAYLEEATATGQAERWQAVFSYLDAEPDRPIATVLTTPLMLWLARTIYKDGTSDPGELADDRRFADQEIIERHLLEGLVPAVYDRKNGLSKFGCSTEHAQRWLAFLAAYLEKTHSRDLEWWQLTRAVRGWRPVGVAARAALLSGVVWWLALWVLWRDHHREHSYDLRHLLGGPLGRHLLPSVTYIQSFYLRPIYHDLRSTVDAIISSFPWHSLSFFELWVVLGATCSGVSSVLSSSPSPRMVKIRPIHIASAAVRRFISALAHPYTLILLLLLIAAGRLLSTLAGLLLLLAILWILTDVGTFFIAPLNVSRSVSPAKVLQLDRQAMLLEALLKRVLRVALVWLILGPTIALGYTLYAATSLLCRIVLGSLGTASGHFADARIWLACTRRTPLRAMGFLADAHGSGILRQVGAVYQFRHIRLQKSLSAGNRVRLAWLPFSEPFSVLSPLAREAVAAAEWAEKLVLNLRGQPMASPSAVHGSFMRAEDQRILSWHMPPLLPNEEQLITVRKHLWVLAPQSFAVMFGLFAAFLLSGGILRHNHAGIYEVWGAWAILMLHLIWNTVNYCNEFFVVTSQRILLTSGVLRRKVAILPLARVTGMKLQPSFMGQYQRYGKIIFESAAGDHELQAVDYIPFPEQLFLQLSDLIFNGNDPGARAAFQQVIDSGHPDEVPGALVGLGTLLSEQGDADGARSAFQQAIDSGHADCASMAAISVGGLLDEQGDADGARSAFQQAIDFGHADYAPIAAICLGILLDEQGDADGARSAFQQAIDFGHADYAPMAAANLGHLLAAQGDVKGAQVAYQQAIDSGHGDLAEAATRSLEALRGPLAEP